MREGKTHQIPGMIQVGKKKGNQPLDDAIMDHLRNLRISPEEAYEKANDKKKFRPFLTSAAGRLRRTIEDTAGHRRTSDEGRRTNDE